MFVARLQVQDCHHCADYHQNSQNLDPCVLRFQDFKKVMFVGMLWAKRRVPGIEWRGRRWKTTGLTSLAAISLFWFSFNHNQFQWLLVLLTAWIAWNWASMPMQSCASSNRAVVSIKTIMMMMMMMMMIMAEMMIIFKMVMVMIEILKVVMPLMMLRPVRRARVKESERGEPVLVKTWILKW